MAAQTGSRLVSEPEDQPVVSPLPFPVLPSGAKLHLKHTASRKVSFLAIKEPEPHTGKDKTIVNSCPQPHRFVAFYRILTLS
ncbi:hypothetical protein AV530_017602 [Patagioenas fasciata monilis]|uniref:Uncharacterized protein n=1 Tax=Patagioenas fasciata monilis TaxID=372326 RepID=A0A1V4J996_PATFA|nr:hypothetical protein AV530_017602 [Patagioenas fasciata monilis]